MIFIMGNEKKLQDALNWAVGFLGLKQGEVGTILGVKQSAVSLLLGGKRTIKPFHIDKMAEKIGITPEEVLDRAAKWNGNATLPTIQLTATASEKPGNVLKIDQEHANVIRLFQNKKLALEINHMLVEIEKDNPDKLWKIRNMLDTVFMPEKKDIKKRG